MVELVNKLQDNIYSELNLLSQNLLFIILFILLYIFYNYCLWKIFVKAGKSGYLALIPLVRELVLLDLSCTSWIYLLIYIASYLLSFIPKYGTIIYLVFILIITMVFCHNLAISFNESNSFAFGLLLLGLVFIPILALNKNIHYFTHDNETIFDVNTAEPEMVVTKNTKTCPNCHAENELNAATCCRCGMFFK